MLLARANTNPATPNAIQPASRAARKPPNDLAIGLILTSLLLPAGARAQEAPPNLAKLVAHRESETEAERNQYTYRQTLTVEQLDERGILRGQYREVRDIIFSPTTGAHRETDRQAGERAHQSAADAGGLSRLSRHSAAGADRRPLVELRDQEPRRRDRGWRGLLGNAGAAAADSGGAAILRRVDLGGEKRFQYRAHRRAAPCRRSVRPRAKTCFPASPPCAGRLTASIGSRFITLADDTLQFSTGPQRERLRISYSNYKRFVVDSTFTPR